MTYFIFHTLSLFAFWVFYQVFLKKDTFFERNRWYLLLASGLACAIPFLEIPINQVIDFERMPLQVKENYVELKKTELLNWGKPETIASTLTILPSEKPLIQSINSSEIIGFIYFLGAAISLILFAVRLGKLLLLIRPTTLSVVADPASRYNKSRYTTLKPLTAFSTTGRVSKVGTFSFFNYLFWDNSLELSKEEEKQILAHELAHIKGGHSYDLMYLELQKIVFWFNPLIYLYEKELRNQHEFIADSKATRLSDTESYVSLMVSSLFKSLQINFTHSFHNQQIKQRIKMLNTTKTPIVKGNIKSLLAGLMLGCIVIGFACTKGLEKLSQEQNFSKAEKALMKEYLAESEEFEKKYPNMEMKYTFKDVSAPSGYLDKSITDIDIQGLPNEEEKVRLKYILLELHKYWKKQENIRYEDYLQETKKREARFGTHAEPLESWYDIVKQMSCFQNVNTEEILGYDKWGNPKKRHFWYVRGSIDENGNVESIELSEGTGNAECDQKFLQLIKSIKWKPSIKNGKPQKSSFGYGGDFRRDNKPYYPK